MLQDIRVRQRDLLLQLIRLMTRELDLDTLLGQILKIDGYRRLLRSSMENELRGALKKRADAEAIRVFAANVREVLMSAPMGQRATLAIDPSIRTNH